MHQQVFHLVMVDSIRYIIDRLENAIDSDDLILIGENITISYNENEINKIQITLKTILIERIELGLDQWRYKFLIDYLNDQKELS